MMQRERQTGKLLVLAKEAQRKRDEVLSEMVHIEELKVFAAKLAKINPGKLQLVGVKKVFVKLPGRDFKAFVYREDGTPESAFVVNGRGLQVFEYKDQEGRHIETYAIGKGRSSLEVVINKELVSVCMFERETVLAFEYADGNPVSSMSFRTRRGHVALETLLRYDGSVCEMYEPTGTGTSLKEVFRGPLRGGFHIEFLMDQPIVQNF